MEWTTTGLVLAWIVVETRRNRSEPDRNRFAPVCGRRPRSFWIWFVPFWGRFGPTSTIFGQIQKGFGLGRAISQFKSFGPSSKHGEIVSESFGIVVCRFVVPCRIFWAWFGPASDPNPARNGRFLAGSSEVFGALLAQPSGGDVPYWRLYVS